MNKAVFPDNVKHTNITSIFKKESRNEKENYRAVSILRNLIYQKSLNVVFMINLTITMIRYFYFTKTWRCNTKLHSPNKKKLGLPYFD